MKAGLAVLAIGAGPAIAVTHRPLSGWTILAGLLIVAGGLLLIELTHHVAVEVEP